MTANADSERFQSGAKQYADYLETPEGRLRSDLTFANLQDFLPVQANSSLMRAGCRVRNGSDCGSSGATWHSCHAAGFLSGDAGYRQRTAREAGVTDKVALQHGDAAQLANLFHARSFDVILCHNMLEYVRRPGAVLRGAAGALRDSSAILSVLVRNQAGEVFKAAIQSGDLAAAENSLSAEWAQESLYGGRVRLFTPDWYAGHADRGVAGGDCRARRARACGLLAATGFPQRLSTSGFLNWSANWASDRSLPRSPATHIISPVARVLSWRLP